MPSQARKASRNERYVGIPDSTDLRREFLSCARELLVLLKENEESKDKLKKIILKSGQIHENLNTIKNIISELPHSMPKPYTEPDSIKDESFKPTASVLRKTKIMEKGIPAETKIRKIENQIDKIDELLKELQ